MEAFLLWLAVQSGVVYIERDLWKEAWVAVRDNRNRVTEVRCAQNADWAAADLNAGREISLYVQRNLEECLK